MRQSIKDLKKQLVVLLKSYTIKKTTILPFTLCLATRECRSLICEGIFFLNQQAVLKVAFCIQILFIDCPVLLCKFEMHFFLYIILFGSLKLRVYTNMCLPFTLKITPIITYHFLCESPVVWSYCLVSYTLLLQTLFRASLFSVDVALGLAQQWQLQCKLSSTLTIFHVSRCLLSSSLTHGAIRLAVGSILYLHVWICSHFSAVITLPSNQNNEAVDYQVRVQALCW